MNLNPGPRVRMARGLECSRTKRVVGKKKESGGKLMRPKFSKEETLALGTMALSFIVVNGRPDEKAESK